MKDNNIIYTPKSLWVDFKEQLNFKESFINEFSSEGITYKNFYFSGIQVDLEEVRIYTTLALPNKTNGGVILVVGNPSKDNNVEIVSFFAKRGFIVLMPDLKGVSNESHYTVYPTSVSYANYVNSSSSLFKVGSSVKETCWYIWATVIKSTISYIKNSLKIDKIALYGIETGADICWVCADESVTCFTAISGAGWQLFNSTNTVLDVFNFTDEQRKFVAGIEAESYAPYVKCPVLYLSPTNSFNFDIELAMDTLARLSEEVYCDYSPRMRYYLDSLSLNTCLLFFEKHLCGKEVKLYSSPNVSLVVKDGFVNVNVSYESISEIAECEVYYSTHQCDIFKRNWILLSKEVLKTYTISSANLFELVYVFVRVKYNNGFTVCSPITIKSLEEKNNKRVSKILYSGIETDSSFACLVPFSFIAQNYYNEKEVGIEIKNGPFQISGAYCKSGLIDYSIGAVSKELNANCMIKFDFYSEKYNVFTVSLLVCEGKGHDVKEYKLFLKSKGIEAWNNFCESLLDFKDENGKSIKDFSSIYAITFCSE